MRNGRRCDAAARSCIEPAGACRTMVRHRVRCDNFTSMKLRRTRATLRLLAVVCAGDVASGAEPLSGQKLVTLPRIQSTGPLVYSSEGLRRVVSAGLRLEVR